MREYKICEPVRKGSFDEEWEQCLDQLVQLNNTGRKIIKLVIFADLPDLRAFFRAKEEVGKSLLKKFYTGCPAYNVIVQLPDKPWKVTVEALTLKAGTDEIVCKIWESIPYVVIKSGSGKEVWAAGLGDGQYSGSTARASRAAFDQMITILESEKMSLDHVVRQWNYVGEILSFDNGYQNYQVFNETRSDYYRKFRTVRNFPAATGVGVKCGGFILDFHAVNGNDRNTVVPLDNPDQVNAYNYNEQVLVGQAGEGRKRKNPPMFERALIVHSCGNYILYVSGTASIKGQNTIGLSDIAVQTDVTIENIKKLTDIERLRRLKEIGEISEIRLLSSRIYIKNRKDFEAVRDICKNDFSGAPAAYVEADICRDDLLVEIEAEYEIKT